MVNKLTNKQLADKLNKKMFDDVTPRQISKSRRRGWIWKNGKKIKYKAPEPVYLISKGLPKRSKNAKQKSKT